MPQTEPALARKNPPTLQSSLAQPAACPPARRQPCLHISPRCAALSRHRLPAMTCGEPCLPQASPSLPPAWPPLVSHSSRSALSPAPPRPARVAAASSDPGTVFHHRPCLICAAASPVDQASVGAARQAAPSRSQRPQGGVRGGGRSMPTKAEGRAGRGQPPKRAEACLLRGGDGFVQI